VKCFSNHLFHTSSAPVETICGEFFTKHNQVPSSHSTSHINSTRIYLFDLTNHPHSLPHEGYNDLKTNKKNPTPDNKVGSIIAPTPRFTYKVHHKLNHIH